LWEGGGLGPVFWGKDPKKTGSDFSSTGVKLEKSQIVMRAKGKADPASGRIRKSKKATVLGETGEPVKRGKMTRNTGSHARRSYRGLVRTE